MDQKDLLSHGLFKSGDSLAVCGGTLQASVLQTAARMGCLLCGYSCNGNGGPYQMTGVSADKILANSADSNDLQHWQSQEW